MCFVYIMNVEHRMALQANLQIAYHVQSANRLELQLACLERHQNLANVGGVLIVAAFL
jgi:hypothetical protein